MLYGRRVQEARTPGRRVQDAASMDARTPRPGVLEKKSKKKIWKKKFGKNILKSFFFQTLLYVFLPEYRRMDRRTDRGTD